MNRPDPTDAELDAAAERIATILHQTLCTYDHTEGCSWELYDHGWTDGAHYRWKAIARYVLDHAFGSLWDATLK